MKYLDKDFFKFTLGFLSIIFLSLLIIAAVSTYAAGGVAQVVFTTDPQSISINTLSGPITIQTQDSSGVSTQTTETLDLSFESTSPSGEFLGGTGKLAQKYMSKNTANRTFYYRDSAVGTFTITLGVKGRVSGLEWSVSQQIIISSEASPQHATPKSPYQKTEDTSKVIIEPTSTQSSNNSSTPTTSATATTTPIVLPPTTTKSDELKTTIKETSKPTPKVTEKNNTDQAGGVALQTQEATSSENILYEAPERTLWWSRLWNFIKNIFS